MKNTRFTMNQRGIIMGIALSLAAVAGNAHALTLYTAGPGALAKKLAAGYEKQTGVKVDVFQATTGKVMARLEAEQANPRADVLISASWDTATDLQQRGWLLEFTSPNAATVPAQFKTPFYVAQGISALGIVWNSKSGTPEPKDWNDLTRPEFKDKVTTPDPALSGASLDLLIGLQNAEKEKAWDMFDRLKANGMIIAGPNAQALTPVLQGAKAAVFGAVDYVSYGRMASGESIKVIFPASGTVIAPRPMMIMKSSKNPQQAKDFINYMLSDEGQKAVADAWLMPARQDIAAKRPLFKNLTLLPEGDSASASRAAVLNRFAALFGQR
ncbi:ABC transporter substrate-binding protein [Pectobacterium cacticida]|uniref:ABC transporter substrate-binding protein n=1 Tax=Pectobacterium cacticida TaxID=69221 RepID=A0ABZ2GGJ3_9GAMM|nr:ABC transporter substrate-binding protein [Pectobacterium cacticida]UYX05769.1 ABC transporter substrate-binding protein [Pectobacterium cacticida]